MEENNYKNRTGSILKPTSFDRLSGLSNSNEKCSSELSERSLFDQADAASIDNTTKTWEFYPSKVDRKKRTQFQDVIYPTRDRRVTIAEYQLTPDEGPMKKPTESTRDLNAKLLYNKMCRLEQETSFMDDIESDDDDDDGSELFPENFDEKIHRLEFELRRKKHYTEFQTVNLARQLIEKEFGDFESELYPVDGESKQFEYCADEMGMEEGNSASRRRAALNMKRVRSQELTGIESNDDDDAFDNNALPRDHPCYGRDF